MELILGEMFCLPALLIVQNSLTFVRGGESFSFALSFKFPLLGLLKNYADNPQSEEASGKIEVFEMPFY